MPIWVCFTPILAAGFLTGVVAIVLQMKNAGLTETQLFQRFWKLWIVLVVLDLSATAASIYWLITRVQSAT